jgi:hypothetical protein
VGECHSPADNRLDGIEANELQPFRWQFCKDYTARQVKKWLLSDSFPGEEDSSNIIQKLIARSIGTEDKGATNLVSTWQPDAGLRSGPARHDPRDDPADDASLVLARAAFQGVGAFEGVRPGDAHLPAVIRLGADDQNPPVAGLVGKKVLDCRANLGLGAGVSDVVHLD